MVWAIPLYIESVMYSRKSSEACSKELAYLLDTRLSTPVKFAGGGQVSEILRKLLHPEDAA